MSHPTAPLPVERQQQDLRSPRSQFMRLRESTKGVYFHIDEAALRAAAITSGIRADDPILEDAERLQTLLERISQDALTANSLAHQLAVRCPAI